MKRLSNSILKYFWGDNLRQLNWKKNKAYIAKTILEKGDKNALKWLFDNVNRTYLKKILRSPRMEPKSKNFWHTYFS
ncbi:hypothetical protein HY030_00665 [Candidatus Gottesmanbacteria bacterium]|nr:hypothetical protein [Candidatus Gottesmanbacteria bacterium]